MSTPQPVIGKSLRDSLVQILPFWIRNVPGFNTLYKFLWTIALLGDCLQEMAWQGALCGLGLGDPSCLPFVGATNDLIQGPFETTANFLIRNSNWIQAGKQAGKQALLLQIQAYLTYSDHVTLPTVICVDRSGNVMTANSDGTISFSTSPGFDWDEVNGWIWDREYDPPELSQFWSDIWLIVTDNATAYTGFSDPNWLAAWNSGDQTVDRFGMSQVQVAALFNRMRRLKPPHTWLRGVIFTANPAAYLASLTTGDQGNDSKNVAGAMVVSRNPANAYWELL